MGPPFLLGAQSVFLNLQLPSERHTTPDDHFLISKSIFRIMAKRKKDNKATAVDGNEEDQIEQAEPNLTEYELQRLAM